jgi:hypothetical protein
MKGRKPYTGLVWILEGPLKPSSEGREVARDLEMPSRGAKPNRQDQQQARSKGEHRRGAETRCARVFGDRNTTMSQLSNATSRLLRNPHQNELYALHTDNQARASFHNAV